MSVRQRDETITTAPISIFSHQAWVVFTGVQSRLKGRDLLGSTHGFVLSVYLCMSVLNLYVQCVSVTAIIQALLLSRCISGFNLFSHRLLFHLSLSSLSHHLSLTQNQITFTLMTVELKQWKTNISHGDKTLLKPIIPSLPLPFYLCGCLSPSLSISSTVSHFQFLYCQSLHPSSWMIQTAIRTWGGQYSLMESRWMFNVSKDRNMHRLSWTHGIASLQSEPCLSAIVKVMRLHLNGHEVFLRTKGEQPLMILSRFCPSRTFWQLHGPFDWRICPMSPPCLLRTQMSRQNITNEIANKANPLNFWSLSFFWGLICILCCISPSHEKIM